MEYKVLIFSLVLSVVACNEKTENNKGTTAEHSKILDAVSAQDATAYLDDPDNIKMKYPVTKKGAVEDDFFGVKVKDPYLWLEDAVREG
jgi:prolyl oligopeptidase